MVAASLLLMAQAPAPQPRPPAAAPRPVDRPPLVPGRDASVLYRLVDGAGQEQEVRVTTQAGGSPMRVDMPDKSFMLVDRRAQRMAMVVMSEETVVDMPYQGPPMQFVLTPAMRFVRKGADTVAGVGCTVWDVSVGPQRGTMCITADGVLLRTVATDDQGRKTLLEAISVSFARATQAEFSLPQDYGRVQAGPNGEMPQ